VAGARGLLGRSSDNHLLIRQHGARGRRSGASLRHGESNSCFCTLAEMSWRGARGAETRARFPSLPPFLQHQMGPPASSPAKARQHRELNHVLVRASSATRARKHPRNLQRGAPRTAPLLQSLLSSRLPLILA